MAIRSAFRFSTFRILLFAILSCAMALPAGAGETKQIYAVFWKGCEHLCRGFQDYLRDRNIDAKVIIRDAKTDKSRLPEFLQEARDLEVDLILSWGTSVTLGLAGTLDDLDDARFNHDIPQVFTGVADPVGAAIVQSLESTGRANITGTFNRVPEAVNITTIRSYMPGFSHLGLLYNRNERNSVIKHEELSRLAETMNFELTAIELPLDDSGEPHVGDIAPAVKALKQAGVDFIYLGSSSFLDNNAEVFTGAGIDYRIPILSPYERLVRDSRALLSIAARYYDVGRLAGEQAEKILIGGAVPGDLPVISMTDFAYVVNMSVARQLDLFPSVEILQIAETVH